MINFDYAAIDRHHQLKVYARRTLSTIQGVQHTYILARHALGQPGAFVECGVAYGGSAVMLQAVLDAKEQREFHLFDSYEGIPLAGPNDSSQPGMSKLMASRDLPIEQRLKSSGISCSSVDQVKGHFAEWHLPIDHVHFHKGWFQHTLPKNDLGPIALLHLDGDLYESTLCCLEWLYRKVVPGGIVLVDDWALSGSRRAVMDFFDKNKADIVPPAEMPVTVDTGACYWVKSL